MTWPCHAITSAQNPRIKQLLKLRQSRGRARHERIIIDGSRELALALRGGVEVEAIYVAETLVQRHEELSWLATYAEQGGFVGVLPESLLARVAFHDRTDQPVAVALPPDRPLSRLSIGAAPCVAIVEGVEKPGNLGALIRSADGAGLDGVIVADAATDLFNPQTIRASLGTVFTAPVATASIPEILAWLETWHITPCVARVDGRLMYDAYDFCGPTAIVLGSEAWGVSDVWTTSAAVGIQLPMLGRADSLNVSATAAILFYEAQRQRRAARAKQAE